MPLTICSVFFRHLNSKTIRYCHWKSNIRLDKALNGKTDLDILVHRQDKVRFNLALREYGFIQVLSPLEKRYPDMEDYLGFDPETGMLVHLHVHYSLILGQKYIKNHHLPIEDLFFQNLVTRDTVMTPCPELELLILIIRAHMKTDLVSLAKHAVKDILGQKYTPFPADIEEELAHLIERCDIRRFKDILQQSGLPIPEEVPMQFIERFIGRRLRCVDVVDTMRLVFSSLQKYRRRKGWIVHLDYLKHYLAHIPGVDLLWNSKQKTLPCRGKVFSLVGADGSGKSTLLKDLVSWLSWKMSTRTYYYGIPKTRYVGVISFAAYTCRRLHLAPIALFLERCLWIYIARQRYKVYVSSQKDARQGHIVITDRFPLAEFQNMQEPMDGPRLGWSRSGSGSRLAKIEDGYYSMIKDPDMVIVLRVAPDEIRRRKSDLGLKTHMAKVAAVNSLKGSDRMSLVDANEPYDDVLLKVKRIIWQQLCSTDAESL